MILLTLPLPITINRYHCKISFHYYLCMVCKMDSIICCRRQFFVHFYPWNQLEKLGFPPFLWTFHPFWFSNLICFSDYLFQSFQNLDSVLLKARETHNMQQLPLRRERDPGLKNIFVYWSLFYRAISFHFQKWGHFSSKSWWFSF